MESCLALTFFKLPLLDLGVQLLIFVVKNMMNSLHSIITQTHGISNFQTASGILNSFLVQRLEKNGLHILKSKENVNTKYSENET